MNSISIERMEQLENERQETMISESFQEWRKSLNVSRLYSNPEPTFNAREMNQQYDFNKSKVARLISSSYL